MKTICKNCGTVLERARARVMKGNCYCNASCQLDYEYRNGVRDRFETGIKARLKSHKKQKEHNWLNDEESRDKLRESMQTDAYREKMRNSHLGKLNGMFGKRPWNYVDGRYRGYGSADRGFDWKKIRQEVRERDNNMCQLCGSNTFLQVHHYEPYKSTQNNDLDNLITLCSKCHSVIENQCYKVNDIKKEFVENVDVFNIEVEDDHTYVVSNMIVHNCRCDIEPVLKD